MIRLLWFLILGHVHKWTTIEKRDLLSRRSGATGKRFILRCERCGTIKKKDLI